MTEVLTGCKCNMTGWVKARIPAQFQHEYGGRTWGWALCDNHGYMAGEDTPPENSQPDPLPYDWEK